MFRHIIPTVLTFVALSSNPVYAQGEGRRAIKAKDLEKEQLSAALLEAAHQNRLEYIKEIEDTLSSEGLPDDAIAGLLFRVAEQYFQEGKYYYFKEMEAFNTKYFLLSLICEMISLGHPPTSCSMCGLNAP